MKIKFFILFIFIAFLQEARAQLVCDGPLEVRVLGASTGKPIDIIPIIQDVYCGEGSDGYIDLSVIGGSPEYQFMWDNGDSTQQVGNLPQGAYNVTVTDGSGCAQVVQINVEVMDPVEDGMSLAMETACGFCTLSDGKSSYFYHDDEYIAQLFDEEDNQDVGDVQVCAYMRPDFELCGSAPEMKRYWEIDADEYTGTIRLFMSQAELRDLATVSGFMSLDELLDAEALCLARYDGGERDCQSCEEADVYMQQQDFSIYEFDAENDVWALEVEVDDYAAFYLQVCGVSVNSDFISLNADLVADDIVELAWVSNAPDSITHYFVERSMDNENWENIGRIDDSSIEGLNQYAFVDNNAPRGMVYYRILQVMKCGTFVYSNTITVANLKDLEIVSLGNPFTDVLAISVETNKYTRFRFTLYDEVGRLFFTDIIEFIPGIHRVEWATPNLGLTNYVLLVDDANIAGDEPKPIKLQKIKLK